MAKHADEVIIENVYTGEDGPSLRVAENAVGLVTVATVGGRAREMAKRESRERFSESVNLLSLIPVILRLGRPPEGVQVDTHNRNVLADARQIIRRQTVGQPDTDGVYPPDSPAMKALADQNVARVSILSGVAVAEAATNPDTGRGEEIADASGVDLEQANANERQ